MPGTGVVSEASPDVPFLGAIVEFDLAVMREVLDGVDELEPTHDVSGGVSVADIDDRMHYHELALMGAAPPAANALANESENR